MLIHPCLGYQRFLQFSHLFIRWSLIQIKVYGNVQYKWFLLCFLSQNCWSDQTATTKKWLQHGIEKVTSPTFNLDIITDCLCNICRPSRKEVKQEIEEMKMLENQDDTQVISQDESLLLHYINGCEINKVLSVLLETRNPMKTRFSLCISPTRGSTLKGFLFITLGRRA